MTTSFYVRPDLIRGDRLALPEDEARHASKVLRARPGGEIVAVDGEGGWYRVRLEHVDRSGVVGHIVERRRDVGEPGYDFTLGMAVVKHRARFETVLEKAAELGVAEVVPIITERTEKEQIRPERSENKLIAAMKQCGRSRMVKLGEPTRFEEYLTEAAPDIGLCCHEEADPENHVLRVLLQSERPRRIAALVGPEGGFTAGEVRRAQSEGWRTVSMGARRLRSETAAIAVAAAVAFAYDSM